MEIHYLKKTIRAMRDEHRAKISEIQHEVYRINYMVVNHFAPVQPKTKYSV